MEKIDESKGIINFYPFVFVYHAKPKSFINEKLIIFHICYRRSKGKD
jgi:hypothetical protein